MSTQQDIYVAGSENRPLMLNKDNYVPWSSRLLRYTKSKPNGKFLVKYILEGPYRYRMIGEPDDLNHTPHELQSSYLQTDDELTATEAKQVKANDQSIQTILTGLPEDIDAAVDSCNSAKEIWLRVQQMMKGTDIGVQEKESKLLNELERFTSIEGESIESYYHREVRYSGAGLRALAQAAKRLIGFAGVQAAARFLECNCGHRSNLEFWEKGECRLLVSELQSNVRSRFRMTSI
ncbi:hypothetical protein Tco_0417443 [Tanacetum coccineum]